MEERSRPGDDDRDLDVLDSEDNQGDENKEDTPQASGTPDQHFVTHRRQGYHIPSSYQMRRL